MKPAETIPHRVRRPNHHACVSHDPELLAAGGPRPELERATEFEAGESGLGATCTARGQLRLNAARVVAASVA